MGKRLIFRICESASANVGTQNVVQDDDALRPNALGFKITLVVLPRDRYCKKEVKFVGTKAYDGNTNGWVNYELTYAQGTYTVAGSSSNTDL